MLEVMKRVEECITCEKKDPASYAAALSLGIVQEFQPGQKVRMLPTEAASTVTHIWPYVKWDESTSKLVPDSSKDPLSTKVLERCLLLNFMMVTCFASAPLESLLLE